MGMDQWEKSQTSDMFKGNVACSHKKVTTWMNLKNIRPYGWRDRQKKTNSVWIHLYETFRTGIPRQTEGLMVARGWGEGKIGNDCLMRMGSPFRMITIFRNQMEGWVQNVNVLNANELFTSKWYLYVNVNFTQRIIFTNIREKSRYLWKYTDLCKARFTNIANN